ncbi:MAG TPA: hypothetical protein PLZ31_11480 [Myxococcota bacterium]|nr:hypothetical protein [Myxococcota bacterium]
MNGKLTGFALVAVALIVCACGDGQTISDQGNSPDTVIGQDQIEADNVVNPDAVDRDADTPEDNTMVTDSLSDSLTEGVTPTDSVTTDNVHPTVCEGDCVAGSDIMWCLEDALTVCSCGQDNIWVPTSCATVCAEGGMAGDQCITGTDGQACDCFDNCPSDPEKMEPGICGCGVADVDTDLDGTPDCNDLCPRSPIKTEPGICGCFRLDGDTDLDGTQDCMDGCPFNPNMTQSGVCGCITPVDVDGDGYPACLEQCDTDPDKQEPGVCGCGVPDDNTDTDDDGTPDCNDACPLNKYLATDLGDCGDCDWIWWTCPPEGQNCYEFCHGDPINHPDPCEPCL